MTFNANSGHSAAQSTIWQSQVRDAERQGEDSVAEVASAAHSSGARLFRSTRMDPGCTPTGYKQSCDQPFTAVAKLGRQGRTGAPGDKWRSDSLTRFEQQQHSPAHSHAEVGEHFISRHHSMASSAGTSRRLERNGIATPRPGISAMPLPTPHKLKASPRTTMDGNSAFRTPMQQHRCQHPAQTGRASTPTLNSFRLASANSSSSRKV